MDNLTSAIRCLKFIKKWFEDTPKYPYAKTWEEAHNSDNALAKADLAWRLCDEGKVVTMLLNDTLTELLEVSETLKVLFKRLSELEQSNAGEPTE